MNFRALLPAALVLTPLWSGFIADAKENKPKSWGYVRSGPVEVRANPSSRRPAIAHLASGALVKVYGIQARSNFYWCNVEIADLETLAPRMGWVESHELESVPLDRFPTDADLLKLLGGTYLDDFTASHVQIVRFLLRLGSQEPALVCLLASPVLPQVRLQLFHRSQGKFVPGPSLEFPYSETKPGLTAVEVRDLFGDGNECLITHEAFTAGLENRGVNLIIRRIEGGQFNKLWEVPLEHRNLASFPPKSKTRQPPEENIGAPGTVTSGDVSFQSGGGVTTPVWKGKVELYVPGREKPIETLSIEKACPWTGTRFTSLR